METKRRKRNGDKISLTEDEKQELKEGELDKIVVEGQNSEVEFTHG